MRVGVLALLACGLVAQSAAQDATIEGFVTNSVTHAPIEGVHVGFYALRAGGAPPNERYGAISKNDGRFSIAGIRAATYGFNLQRNGFVSLGTGARTFPLEPGEHKSGFVLEMTPEAVISGRVVDENNDPVENARVSAEFFTPVPPAMQFVLQTMRAQTDERGMFRFGGAPGRFYISASVLVKPGVHEVRSDGTEPAIHGQTWYPASESRDRAIPVEATAGRETSGIDIRLAAKRSLTISGTVSGMPGGAGKPVIRLSTKYYNRFPYYPDASGAFALAGLAADHYRLSASYEAVSPALRSQIADVDLSGPDVSGVNLRLAAGVEAPGSVEVEGMSQRESGAQARKVHLDALDSSDYVEMKGGETDRQGDFRISPVYARKLRVRVEPMPENAYIKAVQVNGKPAEGAAVDPDVIDLSEGAAGASLKITISLKGGQIEGTVLSEAGGGKPRGAVIVLAESEDDIDQGRYRQSADAGKKYKFAGLRPGKFRFLVVDFGYDPERIRAMFAGAPEIEVREGDRIVRDVTLGAGEKPRATP